LNFGLNTVVSTIVSRWIRILLVLALAFAGLVFGVRALERALTFHPAAFDAANLRWQPPAGTEEFWIPSPAGKKLHCWLIRPPEDELGVILYSHGNGGNLTNVRSLAELVSEKKFAMIVWDYPGYGRSDGPLPADEDELFASAAAVYDFFSRRQKKPLYVWGQSLGTTVSANLCTVRPCRALVMESGLSSARHYAETRVPWIPTALHVFAVNRFESAEKLGRVRCRLLIAHGTADRTIDYSHGQILFAQAAEPKHLLTVPDGTHWLAASAGYVEQVTAFLAAVP